MIDFKQVLPFFEKNDNVSSANSEINFEGKTQKELRDFKRDIANSKKQELSDDAFISSKKDVNPQQKLEKLKQTAKKIDEEINEIRIALQDLPPDSQARDKLQQKLTKLYEFGNKVLDEYAKSEKKCEAKNEKIIRKIKNVASSIDEVRTLINDLPEDSPVRHQLEAKLDNLYELYFKLYKESVL